MRLRALDGAGRDVLPATWSDNFVTLLSGEHLEVQLEYEEGMAVEMVTAHAFNEKMWR